MKTIVPNAHQPPAEDEKIKNDVYSA